MLKSLKSLIEITQRHIFLTLLMISVVALLFSFSAEHFLNLAPCRLCIAQRSLYVFLAIVAIWGLLSRFKKYAINLCRILLVLSFAVASYHSFIQFGIVKDRCIVGEKIETIDSYEAFLKKTYSGCSENSMKIFNIPIPILNGLLSLLIILLIRAKRPHLINPPPTC